MAKCLIVDDSKFMRKIIRDALESEGHVVMAEADNGFDGVEAYKSMNPDFITMDITMGGKDGIMAVKEITDYNSNAKVIVISALNEQTIKMNDPDIKAVAYLTKPFNKQTLLKIVKESI